MAGSSLRSLWVVVAVALVLPMRAAGRPMESPSAEFEPVNDCHSTDNGDPSLDSLTLSPASVDVRTGARRIRFTATASDTGGPGPASGVAKVWLYAQNRYWGNKNPIRYEAAHLEPRDNGTWVGSMTIPRWTSSGSWVVLYASVSDGAGNARSYGRRQIASSGFASTFDVTSHADHKAPVLRSFTFTPRRVDTRSATRQVTFIAKIRETESHVASAVVYAAGVATSLRKIKGSANRFRVLLTVSRWGSGDTSHVAVSLADRIGNQVLYDDSDLHAAGFPDALRVVSRSDADKPSLAALSRRPAVLDVRTSGQTVQVRLRARDDRSGVSFAWVHFTSPDKQVEAAAYLERVTGTRHDGVWKGTTRVSRCLSEQGDWKAFVGLHDAAGNYHRFSARALARKGLPSKITVIADDYIAPLESAPARVAPGESIDLVFNEPVNGISNGSATLRPYGSSTSTVAGSWECVDAAGGPTDCLTGHVSTATFDPELPLAEFALYVLEVNPAGSLGVTNLAGNPAGPNARFFIHTTS
jgi:hypothetical protein